MIQNNRQANAIKFASCYVYKTAGVHNSSGTGVSKALAINFYGIDKTGSDGVGNLISTGYLETTSSYESNGYASNVVIAISSKEYPYIYITYDESLATDFRRIVGKPKMFVETMTYPDILDSTIYTKAE